MGREKNAENIPFLRSTQPKSTERVPVVELSGYHKRIFRIIHQFNLTLPQKLPLHGFSSDHRGHIAVAELDRRWCSDGLEFRCLNGVIVTATFVIDCCDRGCLSLVAKSGKGLTPAMVRDALIIATERRFENLSGNHVLVQFLTDNGAAYTSISTQTSFADWC